MNYTLEIELESRNTRDSFPEINKAMEIIDFMLGNGAITLTYNMEHKDISYGTKILKPIFKILTSSLAKKQVNEYVEQIKKLLPTAKVTVVK